VTYRIFEIGDDGHRSAAGWGDHATIASAKDACERMGRLLIWRVDTQHDAVDALLAPGNGIGPVQIAIEPIHGTKEWTTQ